MADGLGNKAAIQSLIQTEVYKILARAGMTDEGGFFSEFIAGEDLVRGEVVQVKQGGTSRQVIKNAIDSEMPIGVVYASASVGELVKIVHSGIAYVLPNAADTATIGYIIYSSSTTAGRVSQSATIPAVTQHNREIGHLIETGSGAGVLARAILHWN